MPEKNGQALEMYSEPNVFKGLLYCRYTTEETKTEGNNIFFPHKLACKPIYLAINVKLMLKHMVHVQSI
jgi:hypothetical protein